MRRSRSRVVLVLVAMLAGLLLGGVAVTAPAVSHEEREATFPDGTAKVPRFLGLDNPRKRVVCQPGSARRIAAMPSGPLKRRNQQLLGDCEFRSIQSAINSIKRPRTSVYVLPGYYTERPCANAKKSQNCGNLRTDSDDPLPL